MSNAFLRACKSPLLLLGIGFLILIIVIPWVGLSLLTLFVVFLAMLPERMPFALLYEISVLNLITRAKLTKGWWHEIVPGLYVGGIPLANYNHLAQLKEKGIQAVLSIIEDREATRETFFSQPVREEDWIRSGVSYARFPSPDLQPLSLQLLEKAAQWIDLQRSKGNPVYVHCLGGRERSPMAVMAYLIKVQHKSFEEAKSLVKKRPQVRLLSSQEQRMKEFHRHVSMDEK